MNTVRRKTVLLLLLSMFILPAYASAQTSYMDIGVNVPFYWGLGSTEVSNNDVGAALDYIFPVPDFTYGLMFGRGTVKFGVGARFFSLILESLIYPELLVRADFDPVVLRAGIGGGAFLFFGLYNDLSTSQVWVLEATAAYKLNDWFQLGLGGNLLYIASDSDFLTGGYAYAPFVFARFALGGE